MRCCMRADGGFNVIAIEKDARLFRSLRARFIGRTNVECHRGDAVTFRLPSGAFSVVSNVPYAATAAIVRRLLDAPGPPQEALLVLQREAAWKFAGVPRETLFSLQHKPWFDMRVVGGVPRDAFVPRPRVASSLLRITTGELNRIVGKAVEATPPRATRGHKAVKVLYASQVGVQPPTFALQLSQPDDLHFSYKRYLENQIRRAYPFEGSPLVIKTRARKH